MMNTSMITTATTMLTAMIVAPTLWGVVVGLILLTAAVVVVPVEVSHNVACHKMNRMGK